MINDNFNYMEGVCVCVCLCVGVCVCVCVCVCFVCVSRTQERRRSLHLNKLSIRGVHVPRCTTQACRLRCGKIQLLGTGLQEVCGEMQTSAGHFFHTILLQCCPKKVQRPSYLQAISTHHSHHDTVDDLVSGGAYSSSRFFELDLL
jgi:hypothetical protein